MKTTQIALALFFSLSIVLIGCDKIDWDKGKVDDPRTECIDESKIDKEAGCYEIYAPVCGCDGKTYGNDCEAKNAGVTSYKNGPCKDKGRGGCVDSTKIDSTVFCPENIDPVCGCDGVTYNNACNAERNGVTKYKKGRCK